MSRWRGFLCGSCVTGWGGRCGGLSNLRSDAANAAIVGRRRVTPCYWSTFPAAPSYGRPVEVPRADAGVDLEGVLATALV